MGEECGLRAPGRACVARASSHSARSTGPPRWRVAGRRTGARGRGRCAPAAAWLGLLRCLRHGVEKQRLGTLRGRPPPGSLGCVSRRGPSASPGAQTHDHADAEGSRGVTHWWIGRRCVHSLCANRRASSMVGTSSGVCAHARKGRRAAARLRRLARGRSVKSKGVCVCKVECTSVHAGQLSVCFCELGERAPTRRPATRTGPAGAS